ncbi:Uncharacterized protein SCF082_LOCUS6710, partial [Durusdinium trenchii]
AGVQMALTGEHVLEGEWPVGMQEVAAELIAFGERYDWPPAETFARQYCEIVGERFDVEMWNADPSCRASWEAFRLLGEALANSDFGFDPVAEPKPARAPVPDPEDRALERDSQRERLDPPRALTLVKGIGQKTARALQDAGIRDLDHFLTFADRDALLAYMGGGDKGEVALALIDKGDLLAKDLRAVLEEAEEFSGAIIDLDPPKGRARDIDGQAVPPGMWRSMDLADKYGLPQGNPVIPLGMDGTKFFFLNTLGQVVSVADLKAETIKKLYAGRLDFLYWAWPRWSAPPREANDKALTPEQRKQALDGHFASPDAVNGWDANAAADALYNAAAMRGVWRDFELVRGRGAWVDEDDHKRLVLHCGNRLFCRDDKGKWESLQPGDYETAVYPAEPLRPYPWGADVSVSAGRQLLELIETWRWRRDEVDARLLAGWIAAGFLAGALPWRPSVYITGGRGTGKSTLMKKLMRQLFGSGVIYATNVTAASIYQHVGHASLPVILDEFEAQSNPAKTRGVIELMRDSCSDGVVMRGGPEGKGSEFRARNTFAFSSIVRAGMRPQDLSRMAILNLDPFEPGDAEPGLEPKEIALLGRKLLRRVADRWIDFKELFLTWHAGLKSVGHDSRGADQFGILMTCADMILEDEPPDSDTLKEWCDRLAPTGLEEMSGNMPEWERCLVALLSAPVEAWRGGKRRTAGLKVEAKFKDVPQVEWWLSIPSSDEKVRQLFRGSDYEGEAGVDGSWSSSLQQAHFQRAGHVGLPAFAIERLADPDKLVSRDCGGLLFKGHGGLQC